MKCGTVYVEAEHSSQAVTFKDDYKRWNPLQVAGVSGGFVLRRTALTELVCKECFARQILCISGTHACLTHKDIKNSVN